MKKKIALLAAFTLCILSQAQAELNFVEGQWAFTITASEGDDGSPRLPSSFTACITQDDPVPVPIQPGLSCEYSDPEMDGELLIWSKLCKDDSGREYQTSAEINYAGEEMIGHIDTLVTDPDTGGVFERSEELSGRFLGPCKP